jgi:hypothetical protein
MAVINEGSRSQVASQEAAIRGFTAKKSDKS